MKRWSSVTTGLLVIALTAFGFASSSYGQADAGLITLIDGATGLDNWNRVGDANWRAAEGAVQADQKTDKGNSFLVTKNSYTDFQIRVEFWASDDANSGIFMRCADAQAPPTRRATRRISSTSAPTRPMARGPSSISPRYRPCPRPAANGTPMTLRSKARV